MENYQKLLTEDELKHVTNEDLFQEIKDYKKDFEMKIIEKEMQKWRNGLQKAPNDAQEREHRQQLEENKKVQWTPVMIAKALKDEIAYFSAVTFKEINTDTNKVLYWYDWDKGAYTKDIAFINSLINVFNDVLATGERNKICEIIESNAEEKELDNTGRYIVFKNGTYDSEEERFIPYHDNNIYINRACPYNYHKEITTPSYKVKNIEGNDIEWTPYSVIEAFKNGDDNREALFWQLLRAILSPSKANHIFCYAYNEAGNGSKSTIGELFKSLAGDYKNMNLSGLGQRFALVGVEKVPLIYGDDNDTKSTLNGSAMELFKSITQGIAVPIDEKNKPIYEGTSHGVWWQSSNAPMQFNDYNGSLDRRIILLPFKQIPKEQRSTAILSDIIKRSEVIEWFISETIKREPKPVQAFTKPTNNAQLLEELTLFNDPYTDFVDEYIKPLTELLPRIPMRWIMQLLDSYAGHGNKSLRNKDQRAVTKGIKIHMEKLGYVYKNQGRIGKEKSKKIYMYEKDTSAGKPKTETGKLIGIFRHEIKLEDDRYKGVYVKE